MATALRCECGRRKPRDAEACARCGFLDGSDVVTGRLIDAMRAVGGIATLETLKAELGLHERKILDYLARLRRTGRILRIETGAEDHHLRPTFLLADVPRRRAS